jgi:signal transduction histidine kinase
MRFSTVYRCVTRQAILRFGMIVGLVLLSLVPSPPARAADPNTAPIVIGPDFTRASLEGHLSYLRDPDGALDISDVASPDFVPRFEPMTANLALGYTTDTVWVRFATRNVSGGTPDVFLDLRPVFLDEVTVFAPDAERPGPQSYRRILLGDHVPVGERPSLGVSLSAGIGVPPGDAVYYIRTRTTSSMALRGSLLSADSMITETTLQVARFGAFQGIFLLMCIANLLYWHSLRETVYLAYAVTLFGQSLLFFGNNGLLPAELVGPWGVDIALGMIVCFNHALGAWFIDAHLGARRDFPLTHRILVTMMVLAAAATLAVPLGYYHQVVGPVYVLGFIIFGLGLVNNSRLAWRGVPGARSAVLAHMAILGGLFATVGRLTGVLPYNAWTEHGFETGSMLFILYMQLAMARRARRAERERERAQAKALDIARNAERVAHGLVAKRTAELEIQRNRAEDALAAEREVQADQLRFVDVISHQYRTPLAVVSNSVSAIARSLAPDDKANIARIERIRRAIDRLVQLIDVNLHRSRLEGLAAQPTFSDVDVGLILREGVALAADIVGDRALDLSVDPALEGRHLQADRDMIGLALLNLIENADKFSPRDRAISIAAVAQGASHVEFQVRDHGIGIPEAEQNLLTRRYFRASNTANTSGIGLGLHMTAAIARRHGGTLHFSTPPEGGTRVALVLPLASQPATC